MPGTLISRPVLVMLMLGSHSLLLGQVVGVFSGRLGLVMMLGLVPLILSLISRHIRCTGGILDRLMRDMTAGDMTRITGYMTT